MGKKGLVLNFTSGCSQEFSVVNWMAMKII